MTLLSCCLLSIQRVQTQLYSLIDLQSRSLFSLSSYCKIRLNSFHKVGYPSVWLINIHACKQSLSYLHCRRLSVKISSKTDINLSILSNLNDIFKLKGAKATALVIEVSIS